MKKSFFLIIILILFLIIISSSSSFARTPFKIIKSFDRREKDGTQLFTLVFNQPAEKVKYRDFIFSSEKTLAVIFEFEETILEEPHKTVLPVNSESIIKAVTTQFQSKPDIARFVLYLKKPIEYEIEIQENFFKIIIPFEKNKTNLEPLSSLETSSQENQKTQEIKETPAQKPETTQKTEQATTPKTEPKLSIEGHKIWNFSRVTISPISNLYLAQTYFEGIRPTPSGRLFDWREKLKLKISGQVSEKINVSYDLLQDPDFPPDQYNITISYEKTKLTFGDFTTDITGNEFATLTKNMNGVMLTSKDSSYEAALISAKDRSNSKTDAFYGNGSKGPYKLSNTFIVENSEVVYLNNSKLERNRDYQINYYDGEITFTNLLSSTDYVEVKYEYSGIIDLFFPATTRKEFTGARLKINWEQILKKQEKEETISQVSDSIIEFSGSFSGSDSRGPYFFKHKNIVEKSEEIWLDDKIISRDTDYQIDYPQGKIVFLSNVSKLSTIKYRYRYLKEKISAKVPEETKFSTGFTYFQENAPESESTNIFSFSESFTITYDSQGELKRKYQLSFFPLVKDSQIVKLDGVILSPEIDYQVDREKGQINLSKELAIYPGQTLSVDYKYYKNFPYTYTTSGNNSLDSYYLPFRPVVYASEIVRIKESGSDNYKNLRKWDGLLSPDFYDLWEIVYTIDYANGKIDFKQLNDRGQFIPYLMPSSTFIVIDFRYVQEQTTTQKSLTSHLIGADSDLKIGQWEFKTNVAQSESNQPLSFAWQTDEFTGTGEKTYTLSKIPLSGSELVFINGNLLTADIDYLMNYSAKTITFIKYTPTYLDKISVRYRYQIDTPSGLARGKAMLFASKGSLGNLKLEGAYKKIDPNFYPVAGSISRGNPGSKDEIVKLQYDFSEETQAGVSFEKFTDPVGSSGLEPIYLHTQKTGYFSKFKPLGLGILTLDYITTSSFDENPEKTTHDYDNKRTDLKAGFQFGPEQFSTLLEAGRTNSLSDYLDRSNLVESLIYFLRGKNFWQIHEKLKLTTDLQRSEEKTSYFNSNLTKKRTVNAIDLNLKFEPFSNFISESSFFFQHIDPHSLDLKINTNKKLGLNLNYTPSDWLNLRFNRQEEERPNYFENQPNIITTSNNFSCSIKPGANTNINLSQTLRNSSEGEIKKYDLSNFSSELSYRLAPPVEIKVGYNYLMNDSLINNVYQQSFDRIYSLKFNYRLTPTFSLKNGLERNYFLSEQSSTSPGGINGLIFSGLWGAEWQIFNDLTTGLNFKIEDYTFNSTPVTKTNNYYAGTELKYVPLEKINVTLSFNQIFIKNLTGGNSQPGHELKGTLKIPLFKKSWINVEYSKTETNGQLKKTVIEDVKFTKEIFSAGIDFEIPLEGTSTGLIASTRYKRLSYNDRKIPDNNLEGNVISGEVKLQF